MNPTWNNVVSLLNDLLSEYHIYSSDHFIARYMARSFDKDYKGYYRLLTKIVTYINSLTNIRYDSKYKFTLKSGETVVVAVKKRKNKTAIIPITLF